MKHITVSEYGQFIGMTSERLTIKEDGVLIGEYPLNGFVDALILTELYAIPIEFKLTCPKPTKGQKQQLAAYALLAQKEFNKSINEAFISYGNKGKAHKIIIDEKLIRETKKTITKIDNMIKRQAMPDSSATARQCGQCEYINYCNDRD